MDSLFKNDRRPHEAVQDHLTRQARAYLHRLCAEIPTRRVGSVGNQQATDFFAESVTACGFEAATPAFACIDWETDGVRLEAGNASFEASASPYSLGCRVTAPLAVVSTMEELAMGDLRGFVVLLRGDLAREQLVPKNYPFYQSERHQQIIRLLEMGQPKALVTATSRDIDVAGARYPFPLIEDGDFDIPSVYLTEREGTRLARHAGTDVTLESRATRIASSGCNVIARRPGTSDSRIVLFAHIDAKRGSPGAVDDAGGIVVLLLLAELLATHAGRLTVELVAMNGEDYYSAPGEQQYLSLNAGRFEDVELGVNLDGVGYHRGRDAYSLYACPPSLTAAIDHLFSNREDLIKGLPWMQGDHTLFVMNDVPAVAITAEHADELLRDVIHTEKDRPDVVDAARLARLAQTLGDLVVRVDREAGAA